MNSPTAMPAGDNGRVTTHRDGRILVITIDRPAKYNGFTPEMGLQLAAAYSELEQDDGLWVGVVRAQGPHFTAGLDLPRWAPIMKAGGSLFPQDQIDPFEVGGRRRSKPMLVAVKGICFTLGIELMLAADIVVAADDCRFAQLEVKRGIMPTGGATVRITERAGIGNAMLLMLTGDEFGAADALRMGMVQKVVPTGREFDEAMAIARRICDAAPLAVRETLRSIRLGQERGPDAAIAQFRDRQAMLAASQDAAEGVASFEQRRPPRFTGR